MVVVHKCDVCGEIQEEGVDVSCLNRVKAEIGRVSVGIILGLDGTWNAGHVCNKCLANVLREIADKLEKDPESVRKATQLD